jgi:hybrid polyketide synthase/nonribosomal peptide synthetase ACE1
MQEGSQVFDDCELELTNFNPGRTAYDISLDIIDNTGADSLLTFFIQKGLYSAKASKTILQSYVALLDAFTETPDLPIEKPALHTAADAKQAIELGRG